MSFLWPSSHSVVLYTLKVHSPKGSHIMHWTSAVFTISHFHIACNISGSLLCEIS